ncbi:MAG: hypothetical protein M3Y22_04045, partial [Pseudomonadota bacterium]|nr:hypothetical protein [Pseudomonadota bacterium]
MFATARLSTKRRHPNAGRPAEKSAPGFLAYVRQRPCILEGTGECRGKVRACHWDEAGDKGVATKVSDKFALPMCDGHHAEQGDVLGWPKFQQKYGFSAEKF